MLAATTEQRVGANDPVEQSAFVANMRIEIDIRHPHLLAKAVGVDRDAVSRKIFAQETADVAAPAFRDRSRRDPIQPADIAVEA